MSLNDENRRPLANAAEIYKLIPQRPPIVMVDCLFGVSEDGAVTGLTVLPDNIFVERGRLCECGIIEHVAQSAAVFNGYWSVVRGLTPSLGYIAEVKKFSIMDLPPVGSRLRTEIKVHGSFGGMMLLGAQVSCRIPDGESDLPFGEAGSRTDDIVLDESEAQREADARTDGMVPDGWQVVAQGQMKLFMDSKE